MTKPQILEEVWKKFEDFISHKEEPVEWSDGTINYNEHDVVSYLQVLDSVNRFTKGS